MRGVVYDRPDAGIVVGLFRVIHFAGKEYGRINLDGVDMLGSRAQRCGHIITCTCPDDSHFVWSQMKVVGKIVIITD